MTYAEKLKDPRWQKKRLLIMQRDNFTCRFCGDNESTLNVHHLSYSANPWDTPDDELITICEDCHQYEHDNRKNIEDQLISTLRIRGYPAGFLISIYEAFYYMQKFHTEDVMGSVLCWTMRNPDLLEELTQRYFKDLEERSKNRDLSKDDNGDIPF